MKLSTDAKIIAADGQHLGNLNRFVIDPKTKQVTNIVFERGVVNKDERVIPTTLVDHVDEEGIHLKSMQGYNMEDMPPFQEDEYVVSDEHAVVDWGEINNDRVGSVYNYPQALFGSSAWVNPNNLETYFPSDSPTTDRPAIPISGEPPVVKETEQNIPDGTVAVEEGAKVFSSNYKHVGGVEKLLVDPGSLRATHLLITRGLLLKERKLIPAEWVRSVDEKNVFLSVDESLLQRLPDYQEK